MKKVVAIILAVLMLFALCACGAKNGGNKDGRPTTYDGKNETTAKAETPAAKDPTTPSKGLEFDSNGDGTCYVKSLGTCTDTDVVIPAKSPAGDTVTSIGDLAFTWCESLTSVTFGEGSELTSIGNYAFSSCSSLTSIEIPSSVTSIGNSAFSWCESLTSVDIPSSVTSIGNYAFNHCTSLTSIEIPSSVTSIDDEAFSECESLTRVTFANPNGWWVSEVTTATSGTSISSSDLSNASTAAEYLTSTYHDYYWRCS